MLKAKPQDKDRERRLVKVLPQAASDALAQVHDLPTLLFDSSAELTFHIGDISAFCVQENAEGHPTQLLEGMQAYFRGIIEILKTQKNFKERFGVLEINGERFISKRNEVCFAIRFKRSDDTKTNQVARLSTPSIENSASHKYPLKTLVIDTDLRIFASDRSGHIGTTIADITSFDPELPSILRNAHISKPASFSALSSQNNAVTRHIEALPGISGIAQKFVVEYWEKDVAHLLFEPHMRSRKNIESRKEIGIGHLQALLNALPFHIVIVDDAMDIAFFNTSFLSFYTDQSGLRVPNLKTLFGDNNTRRLQESLESSKETFVPFELEDSDLPYATKTYPTFCAGRLQNLPFFFICGNHLEGEIETDNKTDLIARELNHRMKNLFVLVNSISVLSRESSKSCDECLQTFTDRLGMLERTNKVLMQDTAEDSNLKKALQNEIGPFMQEKDSQILCSGPDVPLGPRGFQDLSMIFHELATNSVKYGALSQNQGKLTVIWSYEGQDITIQWQETGIAPNVDRGDTSSGGFGSIVVNNVTKHSLEGSVERHVSETEISYRLTFPYRLPDADG